MADTPNSRRDLWRAVIQQAFSDAATFPSSKKAWAASVDADRETAREWLTTPSDDFDEVCALADWEPSQVRKEALAYIAEADARREAGQSAKPKKVKPPKPTRQITRYTYQGETLTVREWAERTGFKADTIRARLLDNWPIGRALTEPVVKGAGFRNHPLGELSRRLTHEGETLTVTQWAERMGTTGPVIHMRLRSGWSVERALTTPVAHRRKAANDDRAQTQAA